ncbi:MAG: hypothetical protein IKX25_12525 [Bacteroidales bacterium]|nr:hypothetical protein [Bacteroidales bacterium]
MSNYKWKFARIGGVTRVYISSAEDIKHLDELDKKMWTVLSCPVSGLEIDEQSLKYMDTNGDGHIRIDEVIGVSKWLCKVLKDLQPVVEGKDTLPLSAINQEDEEGKMLYDVAADILNQLGKEPTAISLADSKGCLDAYRKNKFEAALEAAKKEAEVAAPYGDKTADIDAAYKALDAKVKDFFLRGKLTKYSKESAPALDVQVASIEGISPANLTDKLAEIASYPIARIKEGVEAIALDEPINPAWAAQFETVKGALDPKAKKLTEAEWNEIGAKLKAFEDYQKSISITEDDITVDEEQAAKQSVDKLLHLTRDFFTLLRNYITLQDLYNTQKWAIFQVGTLVVDQRTCDLCVRVTDAAAMAAQAAKSGMYLLTCDCVSKSTGNTMKIIAAVTVGEVGDLFVGKNCIFYDVYGVDYDAKIVSIIDNPISIKQAMWSPYRKFSNFVSEQVSKFAAEKENAVMADATAKFNAKTAEVKSVDLTNAAAAKEAGKTAAGGFDIAKFSGVFAAIGLGLGMLGSCLVAIFSGLVKLSIWQLILVILAIFLIISGPSMFMAWLKLRKRNLAPILNAQGWAINAAAKINIPFGNVLTQAVNFPAKFDVKDPYPEKTHRIRNFFLILLLILIIAYFICNALGFDWMAYCKGLFTGSSAPANVN